MLYTDKLGLVTVSCRSGVVERVLGAEMNGVVSEDTAV